MRNIMVAMYDQARGTPGMPPGTPPASPTTPRLTTRLNIPKEIEIPVKLRLETIEDIKKTNTEEISKSLNLKVSRLSEIAHIESVHETNTAVKRNLEYLANPQKASTPTERQKYMNIRSELFNRSVKDDKVARQILSSISTSKLDTSKMVNDIVQTMPVTVPVTNVISIKVKVPQDKVASVSNSFVDSVSNNNSFLNKVGETTQTTSSQVQTILTSYKENINANTTPQKVVANISQKTGVEKEKVVQVLRQTLDQAKSDKELVREISQKEGIKEKDLENIIQTQMSVAAEPEKNIEQLVPIPQNVAIEDYEEVKSMWTQQYEKGEVPTSENIRDRKEWLEKDIVFITNTLNQLLSTDENLRTEGLNNLGYILPLFVINNIKGEELLVYLKAKLEAAKSVRQEMTKEQEVMDKLQQKSQTEEEFVDIKVKKADEVVKTMEMEKEEKIPEQSSQTKTVPVTNIISVKIPQDKVTSLSNTFVNSVSSNKSFLNKVGETTQTTSSQVQAILTSYKENINSNTTPQKVVENISQKTGVEKEKVVQVLRQTLDQVKSDKEMVREIAQKEGLKEKDMENIDRLIPIPQNVAIEDYEEIKSMWTQQYEKSDEVVKTMGKEINPNETKPDEAKQKEQIDTKQKKETEDEELVDLKNNVNEDKPKTMEIDENEEKKPDDQKK